MNEVNGQKNLQNLFMFLESCKRDGIAPSYSQKVLDLLKGPSLDLLKLELAVLSALGKGLAKATYILEVRAVSITTVTQTITDYQFGRVMDFSSLTRTST